MTRSLRLLALAAAALVSTEASAQTVRTRDPAELSPEALETVDTHFGIGLLDRPLSAAHGGVEGFGGGRLRFGGVWAPILQSAEGEQVLNDGLDLYGTWGDPDASGRLVFFYERRNDGVLGTDTVEFADELGLGALTNDGAADGARDQISLLYWEQLLFDESVRLGAGQIELDNLFDWNEFAANDRRSFIAAPFSGNPAAPLPPAGLGVAAWYAPDDSWYVGGGLFDGDGKGETPDFETVDNGNWARTAEVGLTPEIDALGRGNYRVNVLSVDESDDGRESNGWSISIDQEMGESHAVFARWSGSDGRRTRVDQLLGAGVLFTDAFGFDSDWLGIGVFWDSPSEGGRQEEFGGELFWRFRATRRLEITPDLYVTRPAEKGEDVRFVFSLRLALLL